MTSKTPTKPRPKPPPKKAASRDAQQTALPVMVYLRRRVRRQRIVGAVALAVVVALVVADHRGWLLPWAGDMGRYDGRWFRVVRVLDGRTLMIDVPDGDRPATQVRLAGLMMPLWMGDNAVQRASQACIERMLASVAPVAAKQQAAVSHAGQVRLALNPHHLRGPHGRLLAFVFAPNTRMLNDELLAEGLAKVDNQWSSQFQKQFNDVAREAKRQGLGVWAKKGMNRR